MYFLYLDLLTRMSCFVTNEHERMKKKCLSDLLEFNRGPSHDEFEVLHSLSLSLFPLLSLPYTSP